MDLVISEMKVIVTWKQGGKSMQEEFYGAEAHMDEVDAFVEEKRKKGGRKFVVDREPIS